MSDPYAVSAFRANGAAVNHDKLRSRHFVKNKVKRRTLLLRKVVEIQKSGVSGQ